jgi:hypothetical protein
MKKIISLIIVLTLLFSMTSFAYSETNDHSEEIDEIFNQAIITLNNNSDRINYLEQGISEFDFTTVSNYKCSVEVKIEKIPSVYSRSNDSIVYEVDDGSYINTTTVKFDPLLGGEMVLKFYYAVSEDVTKLTATDTEAHASAPIGYGLETVDSWITDYEGEGIGGKISATGTYTIKLFGSSYFPITKNLDVNIKILIPGESINVWYSQSL